MRNKKLKKFLKKNQPNSGFTLTELLTGLIMSIFVTGALGFGLYQIMAATSKETAKTNARQDASRAVEFISDELRRASLIETNATNATGFNSSGKTVVLALSIPELNSNQTVDNDNDGDSSDAAMLGSDNNASTPERVVYYLESNSGSNWQGPQVLYRWGPPLNADGEYTQNGWGYEALIDGIDDTSALIASGFCNATGDALTPASPTGFYACVSNQTAAQIFLTGGIDTIANNGTNNDSTYTAQTRAVTRAKNVTVAAPAVVAGTPITFRSLNADYVCNPSGASPTIWTMRTDFDNSAYSDPNSGTTLGSTNRTSSNMNQANQWIHEPGRQAQPINISSDNDLTIHSIPLESTNCSSTGNDGVSRNTQLANFLDPDRQGHVVSHTIAFGNVSDRPENSNDPFDIYNNPGEFWKTFNGNSGGHNNPNVTRDGRVQVLKEGTVLRLIETNPTRVPPDIATLPAGEAPLYPGLDPDGNGPEPARQSLGDFLVSRGYADNNGDGTYTINDTLGDDERIIAFEVGHIDRMQPGFDLQDNVFIIRHEAFDDNY